jgi:hypothetical protein
LKGTLLLPLFERHLLLYKARLADCRLGYPSKLFVAKQSQKRGLSGQPYSFEAAAHGLPRQAIEKQVSVSLSQIIIDYYY